VLEQMNQEDHVTTSFWLVAAARLFLARGSRRPWSLSFAGLTEESVSPPGRFPRRPV
jgi:hypothetical protein